MKNIIQRKICGLCVYLLSLVMIFCRVTPCYCVDDNYTNKSANQNSFLYHQMIQIKKNDNDAINAAMKQALLNVFVKVSSLSEISTNPIIASAINNPQSFISNHLIIKGSTPSSAPMLSINFNRDTIENKLKESGINIIWDEFSPPVLLLICFDDGEKQRILQDDDYFAQTLNKHLSSKGIKTIYPLMDMQDFSSINISDLRGMFLEGLAKTILRYGEPPVLMGYIEKNSNSSYQGRLRLATADKNYDIRFQGNASFNIIEEKISSLIIDKLLPIHSKNLTAKKSGFYIKVVGVSTAENIDEITNSIKKSKIILDLYPHIIKDNELILHAFANFSIATTKSLLEDDFLFQEKFNILPNNSKDEVSMCFEFIANNPKK